MKILLVEDEEFMLEAISSVIEHTGIEVTAVTNADEAKKLLETENFGLIITDLYLPGPEGFELVTYIKQNPKTNHIPVIVATAMEENPQRLNPPVPADYWIKKPFTLPELLNAVRKYLTIAA